MNKIIGLISAWGAEKWVKLSIQQAINICDKVLINVGPYVENVKKFEDKTREICESFGNKIIIVNSLTANSHANAKAKTLNSMLAKSTIFEVGNWIWLFDVDEFYNESLVDNMKSQLFSGNYNALKMDEMYFFINMQHYLKNTRMRLWKIENINHSFIPTNKWTGPRNKKLYYPEFKYFHYSTLMNQRLKKEVYKTEQGSLNKDQREKMEWVDKIYMKYDLSNEEPWIKLNHKLYGKKQPYWISDFKPDENGKLFIYNEKHPKLIEDSGLTKIEDFRLCY